MQNGNEILNAPLSLRETTEMGFARVEQHFDAAESKANRRSLETPC